MSLRARVLLYGALSLSLVALVGAGATAWWRWDTARQPKVTADVPFMDQAIADTLTAAGQDAAVATSGVYRAKRCRLGPVRDGGEYTRKADLYVDPGAEDTVIARIQQALPPTYEARREPGPEAGAVPLLANAGTAVSLSVRQLGAGWLVATASTGCTTGADPTESTFAERQAAATIGDLLQRLGTRPAETNRHIVPCSAGKLVTVAVLSQPTNATQLQDRLRKDIPANARSFASRSNRVAWRDGPTSIIIAASDDDTAITARYTTSC